jgi:hypothetical protein
LARGGLLVLVALEWTFLLVESGVEVDLNSPRA